MSTAAQILKEVEEARELSFAIQRVLTEHGINVAHKPLLVTKLVKLVRERRESDKQ